MSRNKIRALTLGVSEQVARKGEWALASALPHDGMNQEDVVPFVPKSKGFGMGEEAIMALLLAVSIIQIVCAFSAGSSLVKTDQSTAAIVQLHAGPALARK